MLNLFTPGGYIPHGHCYLWQTGLVELHILSDSLIAIAYYSIPLTLLYFVRKRQDLPLNTIFLLFGAFIVACGTTHIMEIWTLWYPTYWLSGSIKAMTALVSVYTAMTLVPLVPQALALPSPAQLEAANRELEQEIVNRQQIEQALRESEERWHLAVSGTNDGIWDWNVKTNKVFFSRRWKEMRGFAEHEIGNSLAEWSQGIHPDDITHVMQAVQDRFAKKTPFFAAEYRVQHKDGSYLWILDRGQALWDESGNVVRMAGAEKDITERKQAEAALRESEARYRAIVEDQTELIVRFQPDGTLTFVNEAFCRYFGLVREEVIGCHYEPVVFDADRAKVTQAINSIHRNTPMVTIENRVVVAGEVRWMQWINRALFDPQGEIVEIQSVGRDISDRKRAEQQQASLQEKEALLKEIHHRVKNNLQIVYSLLRLQQRRTLDRQAADILVDSQNRIKSIALVHEKLYRSDNLAEIDFAQYISSLAASLLSSYRVSSEHIALETKVDPIALDIDKAIPCGLILNELISNSLKYAFPENCAGQIQVELRAVREDLVQLTVSDNGIGIPAQFDLSRTKSLGLQLVHDFVNQLEGTVRIERQQGTIVEISFPCSVTQAT